MLAAATSERDEERESYAFVMNVLDFTDSESYEMAPGHVLRRATSHEISVIKKQVKQFAGSLPDLLVPELLREYRRPPQGGMYEKLPKKDSRYYVIAFRGTNITLHRLQAAMDLRFKGLLS